MTATIAPPAAAWPLPTTFDPRPFQVEGVDRLKRQNLVLDIGLGGGKTTIALAAAEALQARAVVVLCPDKVRAVWRDEVTENAARDWIVWSGEVTGRHGKRLVKPSVARRVEALIDAYKGAVRLGRPFMAVVNYEAVIQRQMAELLLGTPFDMLVCDESHNLASPGGKTSRKVAQIAKRVRQRGGRVVLATGTFMPHSGLSVYGQFRTLDTQVLGTSWTVFKARYAKYRIKYEIRSCAACTTTLSATATDCGLCGGTEIRTDPVLHTTPKGEPIPDGIREDREDELMARIAPHVLRVSQAQLDAQTGLVEPPPQLRTVTMSDETRRVYADLERDLIAKVRDGHITAANAMVNVLRLAQVTSGYGIDADTGRSIALCSPPEKARLLADELADIDPREPVIVFARFIHDYDEIRKVVQARGSRYGEISGRSTSGLDGKRMHPDVDVVCVNPKSGGAGINLTRSRLGIFYSFDFSLAAFDQCTRRYLRQGQTRHVATLVLGVEDSIDITTYYALKRRRDVITALLERLQGGTP